MIRLLARYRHIITGILIIVIIFLLVFFAVKTKDLRVEGYESKSYSGQAFGTSIKKTLFSDDLSRTEMISESIDKSLNDLEKYISYRISDSEIAKLNRSYAIDGNYRLPFDIKSYFGRELEIYEDTNGAFSPCILPVTSLWGIEDGNEEVPSESDINSALEYTDASKIELSDDGIIIHGSNMAFDMGAVGKGIAADKVMEILRNENIPGAVVSIGGTIAVYGDKGTGHNWHIGIQDPRAADGEVLGVLEVTGNSVISTSGDYEKYFEKDGKRYHHIFDPSTGYPVDNGLISVTILSPDGFLSDALSTACFVLGLEDGMKYAEEKSAEAVFVTSDKKVYLTPGLKKKFNIKADGYELAK